jgi:3-deoxy-7-phosphoheptulonate synthase
MLLELDPLGRTEIQPLPSPAALQTERPRSGAAARRVETTRAAIRDLLHGRDPWRLLVVVGPCSIHDPGAALEYASRLASCARRYEDELVIAMRTYFEKPRTTVGWKGLIHDPDLDGRGDAARGLRLARSLLCEINELGLGCGTELLDPLVARYLGDLLSWVAIGARTSESQLHRELASGLPTPVGFKNGTSGNVRVAANSMLAARRPQTAFGVDARGRAAWLRTRGNRDAHLVLRGGAGAPNYAPECVAEAARLGREAGVRRPVLVDCSHDNSGQDPRRQAAVCCAVLDQLEASGEALLGLQIESQLEPGRQAWAPGAALARGVSITDGCIGWDETETLLAATAAAVSRSKRRRRAAKMARA